MRYEMEEQGKELVRLRKDNERLRTQAINVKEQYDKVYDERERLRQIIDDYRGEGMTDPDERIINRAIVCLGDDFQEFREEARAALHRIFRNTRKLEIENKRLRDQQRRLVVVINAYGEDEGYTPKRVADVWQSLLDDKIEGLKD
jgi:DNA repair exonuclease SbcCD ATPase subunit